MKRIGPVAAAGLGLLVSAQVASAQLTGIPFGPVETGLGINIAADYAKPEGGGSAYGVTGGIGFSRFGLSASFGVFDPGSGVDGFTSMAGRFGMKLFGGGLNPISVGVQVGASSTEAFVPGGSRQTNIMPGAWVKVSPPLFPLKPFGHVYYLTGNNGIDKEPRFTVGANFNLLLGLGVHGAYDWGDNGHTWGVGAHFNFRVPGMGVPGVPGM